MSSPLRQCPRCGLRSRRINCCGLILAARRRWRMTAPLIQHVHVIAKVRKGLDEEAYRLNLQAVGAQTSKALSRDQLSALLRRFHALPDAPGWETRGERRERAQRGYDDRSARG